MPNSRLLKAVEQGGARSTHIPTCAHTQMSESVHVCASHCLCKHASCALELHPTGGCGGCVLIKTSFHICLRKIFIDRRMKGISRFCNVLICQFGGHWKCILTNVKNSDANMNFVLDLIFVLLRGEDPISRSTWKALSCRASIN